MNKVMGNLVAAIGWLLQDLGSWMSIIGLIIIPYGLIQENFIYPNQFLLREVLIGERKMQSNLKDTVEVTSEVAVIVSINRQFWLINVGSPTKYGI